MIEKTGQTVEWTCGENRSTIRGQTITDIIEDEERYGYGLWRGRRVAAWHVDGDTWYVI